jgi:hypothetical protein
MTKTNAKFERKSSCPSSAFIGLLADLSPGDLKKVVERIKKILLEAQMIHRHADTKAFQMWRSAARTPTKRRLKISFLDSSALPRQ